MSNLSMENDQRDIENELKKILSGENGVSDVMTDVFRWIHYPQSFISTNIIVWLSPRAFSWLLNFNKKPKNEQNRPAPW